MNKFQFCFVALCVVVIGMSSYNLATREYDDGYDRSFAYHQSEMKYYSEFTPQQYLDLLATRYAKESEKLEQIDPEQILKNIEGLVQVQKFAVREKDLPLNITDTSINLVQYPMVLDPFNDIIVESLDKDGYPSGKSSEEVEKVYTDVKLAKKEFTEKVKAYLASKKETYSSLSHAEKVAYANAAYFVMYETQFEVMCSEDLNEHKAALDVLESFIASIISI